MNAQSLIEVLFFGWLPFLVLMAYVLCHQDKTSDLSDNQYQPSLGSRIVEFLRDLIRTGRGG